MTILRCKIRSSWPESSKSPKQMKCFSSMYFVKKTQKYIKKNNMNNLPNHPIKPSIESQHFHFFRFGMASPRQAQLESEKRLFKLQQRSVVFRSEDSESARGSRERRRRSQIPRSLGKRRIAKGLGCKEVPHFFRNFDQPQQP